MKRKILLVTLLMAAVAVGSGNPASAGTGKKMKDNKSCDCRQHEPGEGREDFLKKMAKDLKLTEAQQGQVKAILSAEREKTAPFMEKLREAGKQLHEAAGMEKFDEAAVRAIAVKRAELEVELAVARAKVRHSINAVLTPEQRTKADKMGPPHRPRPGRGPQPPEGF